MAASRRRSSASSPGEPAGLPARPEATIFLSRRGQRYDRLRFGGDDRRRDFLGRFAKIARAAVGAAYICTTCGLQFPPSDNPPARCPICSDYRQFVPRGGQRWTTLEELRREHRNAFQQLEPGLIAIATTPEF